MMNLGVVLPEPGYLEAVRELTKKHGIVLIFDEVKTGICTAARRRRRALGRRARHGHARQGPGRRPAVRRDRRQRRGHGGRRRRHRVPGRHLQRQPARHGRRPRELREGHDRRGLRVAQPPQRPPHRGCDAVCEKYDFPAYTVGISLQGLRQLRRAARSPTTSRSSGTRTTSWSALAWLYNFNRGVVIAPGREEEWTLSVRTPTPTSTSTSAPSRTSCAT